MMKMYQEIAASVLSEQGKVELEKYVLVDVRTGEEYESGHLPGALHIPYDEMEERHTEIAQHQARPILLICRSGRRSVFAAEVLVEQGFQQLYNLEGGMLEWTGEVEK
jgi:phage shock protein E